MGNAAGAGDSDKALELSRGLRERHYATAGELLGTGVFTQFHSDLEEEFNRLDELLRGIVAVGELTPRTSDYVVSYGERLSSKICTAAFSARGFNATLLDAREVIITDKQHTKAIPQVDEIDHRVQTIVRPLLEAGRVPVMGGFLGATSDGVQTTIGRGGSDFSAALVGAGLNAESIEIWTDVDGMKTTDPEYLSRCASDQGHQLRGGGRAVVLRREGAASCDSTAGGAEEHSRLRAELANPKNEGTLIVAVGSEIEEHVQGNRGEEAHHHRRRCRYSHAGCARIPEGDLRGLRPSPCAVDVVSTSEVSVSLTVDSTEAIPAVAADLEKIADVKYSGRKAIICMVGENIREKHGIAAQVFASVEDINVRMISQGASEINLTFVIDEDDVPEVVRRLHKRFFSDPDPETFD